jgi:hypothetical protein
MMHDDYADEAESAQRGTAWPQAAALWRRAAETCDDAERRRVYEQAAQRCDAEVEVDKLLAGIASRELKVPTLDERKSDQLDFHEVGVWSLRRARRREVVRPSVPRTPTTPNVGAFSSAWEQRPTARGRSPRGPNVAASCQPRPFAAPVDANRQVDEFFAQR